MHLAKQKPLQAQDHIWTFVCKYICTVAFCTSSACDCEKIGLFVSDFFGEKAMAGVADPEEFTWSRVYGVVDTRPKWQEDRIVEVQLSGDCTEIIWVCGKNWRYLASFSTFLFLSYQAHFLCYIFCSNCNSIARGYIYILCMCFFV